jgi:hypothetical protein
MQNVNVDLLETNTLSISAETVKACPGKTENSPPVEVTLSCSAGEVIALGEALLSWDKYERCGSFTSEEDCKVKTDAFKVRNSRFLCNYYYSWLIFMCHQCHDIVVIIIIIIDVPIISILS